MTSQIWSRGSASGRPPRQNEGKEGKGMERRNGGKTVLAEQVVCISHHQHQPLLAFIYLFQFEGVNLQLFRPLNLTLMSSGFLFNIRKKDAKEEKHCVIFWWCATGFCLNLRVLLVRGWTSVVEDVSALLKLCCPSLTARKCGIMVIRRAQMQKQSFIFFQPTWQQVTLVRSDALRSARTDIS